MTDYVYPEDNRFTWKDEIMMPIPFTPGPWVQLSESRAILGTRNPTTGTFSTLADFAVTRPLGLDGKVIYTTRESSDTSTRGTEQCIGDALLAAMAPNMLECMVLLSNVTPEMFPDSNNPMASAYLFMLDFVQEFVQAAEKEVVIPEEYRRFAVRPEAAITQRPAPSITKPTPYVRRGRHLQEVD